jgi:hypothetical protein
VTRQELQELQEFRSYRMERRSTRFTSCSKSSSSSSFVLGWGWRRVATREEDRMEKAIGGSFACIRAEKRPRTTTTTIGR